MQGTEKVIFTAYHLGKLKLASTCPNVISTTPKNFLMSRIILLISQFFCEKLHWPVGQVKNRLHWPDNKIHKPRAIRH